MLVDPVVGAFRGVVVPAGEHTVAFEFSPTVFYKSGLISLLALAGMCLGWALTRGTIELVRYRLYLSAALENAARKLRP